MLSEDFDRVKKGFACLVSKTLGSLKMQNIPCNDLKVLILSYPPNRNKLFSKERTLDEMFLKLCDYWSFFNYELLDLIITRYCSKLEEDMKKYISTFCNRKVSELPANFTSVASGKHYRVILDNEFDSLTVTKLKELEKKLKKITKVDLSISGIDDRSVVISSIEEEDMIPLSEKEKNELFQMGVLELYNFEYFRHEDLIARDPQSALNKIALSKEMSATLKIKESTSAMTPENQSASNKSALSEEPMILCCGFVGKSKWLDSFPVADTDLKCRTFVIKGINITVWDTPGLERKFKR